jgi:predicted enzyme related to lactoylglutathione lyase
MAITGMHGLLYTSKPDDLRAVLRDVFGWRNVDAGDGWLIFALPPAELGIHPTDDNYEPHHEISLMCDDIEATVAELRTRGVEILGEPQDRGFGIGTMIALPGEVEMFLYEPRHPTAV